jgi:hypothetical protein
LSIPKKLASAIYQQVAFPISRFENCRYFPGRLAHEKKILFVCIGKACGSQIAEGFARSLGADQVLAHSGGWAISSFFFKKKAGESLLPPLN